MLGSYPIASSHYLRVLGGMDCIRMLNFLSFSMISFISLTSMMCLGYELVNTSKIIKSFGLVITRVHLIGIGRCKIHMYMYVMEVCEGYIVVFVNRHHQKIRKPISGLYRDVTWKV